MRCLFASTRLDVIGAGVNAVTNSIETVANP